jgi:hypothetical protein
VNFPFIYNNIAVVPAYHIIKKIFRSFRFISRFPWLTVVTRKTNHWAKVHHWLSWSQHFESFTVVTMTNDHEYVLFVVITIPFFPHPWLVTGFVTRVTCRVPQVEHRLLTLPEHLSSPRVLVWFVLVDWSFVFCAVFCHHCLSFCHFSFSHCSSWNYSCNYLLVSLSFS